MSTLSATAVEQLRADLSPSSVVVTKDSETYEESIKRWAASAEKPAVYLHKIHKSRLKILLSA